MSRWTRPRTELILLILLGVSFALFALLFVPRLTNAHFGDVEFTGWSGPVAEHVVRGERPYVDFVLPIPPGSFAILALVQRAMGGALLLQELWLGAVIHLFLALLAFAIASRITTPLNAVLVAVCSLVSLINMYKECAYDHTAQLTAWCSVATGVRALFAEDTHSGRRYWLFTGAFAASSQAGAWQCSISAESSAGLLGKPGSARSAFYRTFSRARRWALRSASAYCWR
jgi:hypothetical protein